MSDPISRLLYAAFLAALLVTAAVAAEAVWLTHRPVTGMRPAEVLTLLLFTDVFYDLMTRRAKRRAAKSRTSTGDAPARRH